MPGKRVPLPYPQLASPARGAGFEAMTRFEVIFRHRWRQAMAACVIAHPLRQLGTSYSSPIRWQATRDNAS